MHELLIVSIDMSKSDKFFQKENFETGVRYKVNELLERYDEYTENIEYLEFEDKTEEIKRQYENDCIDCIRLPEGKIVPCLNLSERFVIKDNKVYQRYTYPLLKLKRTKRAKRMKALANYPIKKLYHNIREYACMWCGYVFNEQIKRYGKYYNSNVLYDYYLIGGLWSKLFLIKDSCKEYVIGDTFSEDNDSRNTLNGYKWVCAARKGDIEWDLMKKYSIHKAMRLDDVSGFLDKNEVLRKWTPFIDGNNSWKQTRDEYFSKLNDDDVIVGIDCHC